MSDGFRDAQFVYLSFTAALFGGIKTITLALEASIFFVATKSLVELTFEKKF